MYLPWVIVRVVVDRFDFRLQLSFSQSILYKSIVSRGLEVTVYVQK